MLIESTINAFVSKYKPYLYIAAAVLFLSTVGYARSQHNQKVALAQQTKEQKEKIEALQKQLEHEQEVSKQLISVHSAYVERIEDTQKRMLSIVEAQAQTEEKIAADYDVKPSDHTPQTKEWEKKTSAARMDAMWKAYCLGNIQDKRCKEDNSPKEGKTK